MAGGISEQLILAAQAVCATGNPANYLPIGELASGTAMFARLMSLLTVRQLG